MKKLLWSAIIIAFAAAPAIAQEKADDALQEMWGGKPSATVKAAPKAPVKTEAPKSAEPKPAEPVAPAPAAEKVTPPPSSNQPSGKAAPAPKAEASAPKEEKKPAEQPRSGSAGNKTLADLLKSKGVITAEEAASIEKETKPKFTFSGEIRFRPEMRDNYDFNVKKDDAKAFVGQRVRLNVKTNPDENIEAFMTIQDTRRWGENKAGASQASIVAAQPNTSTSSGGEAESLDLFEAWFKVANVGGVPLDVKVGRQMMVYGDQRLIGHLGWADSGRAFDAYKLVWRVGQGQQVDLFAAKLIETGAPAGGQSDSDLYGIYTTWALAMMEKSGVDLYYLVWKNTNEQSINTYGLRLFGKPGAWDFTAEAAFQTGKASATVDKSASAYAITAGYTLKEAWNTRLGAEYDYGSGDDGSDAKTSKSFNMPFATNHGHYGYMDFFGWANMKDTKLMVTTSPMGGKASVEIAYHTFQLNEAKDKWYNTGYGTFSAGAATYTKTDAGTEWDVTVNYPYSQSLKLTAGYSWFAPGDAVKERFALASPDNASWGFAMFLLSF